MKGILPMRRVFILGCLMIGLSLPWSAARAADSPKHEAAASNKDDAALEGLKPDKTKTHARRSRGPRSPWS